MDEIIRCAAPALSQKKRAQASNKHASVLPSNGTQEQFIFFTPKSKRSRSVCDILYDSDENED